MTSVDAKYSRKCDSGANCDGAYYVCRCVSAEEASVAIFRTKDALKIAGYVLASLAVSAQCTPRPRRVPSNKIVEGLLSAHLSKLTFILYDILHDRIIVQ